MASMGARLRVVDPRGNRVPVVRDERDRVVRPSLARTNGAPVRARPDRFGGALWGGPLAGLDRDDPRVSGPRHRGLIAQWSAGSAARLPVLAMGTALCDSLPLRWRRGDPGDRPAHPWMSCDRPRAGESGSRYVSPARDAPSLGTVARCRA